MSVLAGFSAGDFTSFFMQLPISPPVYALSRYIVLFSRAKGKDPSYANRHPDQSVRGASRRGGTLPPGVARSSRAPATDTWLSLHPTPRERRPTGEVSFRQCRRVGVSTALPGSHEDRGLPANPPEDAFHCLPSSVPGCRRVISPHGYTRSRCLPAFAGEVSLKHPGPSPLVMVKPNRCDDSSL